MIPDTTKPANPNPFLRANYLSKVFFWWLRDVIRYAKKNNFIARDLYDVISQDLSEPLTNCLESSWKNEEVDAHQRNKKPSLWKAVVRTYYWSFIKFAVFPTCYTATQLVHPQLLSSMITDFESTSEEAPYWAYLNAVVYIGLIILRAVFLYHMYFHLDRLGMQAKIACTSLIYRKLLRLSSSANQKMSTSIISLLTVDAAKFENLFTLTSFLFTVPIQLVITTYLISEYVGFLPASVGVVFLILLTIPIQAVYSKLTLKLRAKQIACTDDRISLISEIINGIRSIKMHVWNKYSEKMVFAARSLEISYFLRISYLLSIAMAFNADSYRLCSFVIMLACTLQRGTIKQILPVTQHSHNLEIDAGVFFFGGLRNITDMSVSMKRIEDFLLLEEVEPCGNNVDRNHKMAISIEHAKAFWNDKSLVFEDLSIDFAEKKFYAIVGSVGSGKSSILKLILGELQTVSGQVSVNRKISYASQEPWLFNGSVKDNILFGEVSDEGRYAKVIEACALSEDFSQLSHGDQTLVGERGSNLSGGQRARVNLARAVYREADFYLLDDPLSAVNATVGNKIMEHCINGLLCDKGRILITHCITQLDGVSEVILLEHGKIKFRGNMEELCRSNHQVEILTMDKIERSRACWDSKKLGTKQVGIQKNTNMDQSSVSEIEEPKETEELLTIGSVKISYFLSYIKAGGWNLLSLILLTNVSFMIAVSAFDLSLGLGDWSGREDMKNDKKNNVSVSIKDSVEVSSFFYEEKTIVVIGGLISLVIFLSISRNLLFNKFALNASRNIHNDVFSRIMTAKLRFFNANSTGMILNRFSEDVGVLDNTLSFFLGGGMGMMLEVTAILATVIIMNWWVLLPASIVAFVTLSIGRIYVNTIQKMKRLAGNARSPILSFASSSVEGLTTIRACRAEHIVMKDFDTRQDRHTAAQFLNKALPQAFSLWIELIYDGFLVSMICFFLIVKSNGDYGRSLGLTLMQILIITEVVPFLVIRITDIMACMVSVERMLQFKELEQESSIEDKSATELTNSWPDKGEILFEHVYLRYSNDNNPVLWDLHFSIQAGLKVGIVGRTGAGKSSLISALFRFTQTEGSVFIDGVNIKKVDLHELRSKISVIPQEPVLFKASLRKNLDPLDKSDDATLYSALESVELKNSFDSLDFPIERGGSNLSVGQRQLVCLARAIIKKNKILILDEATANVDSATDAIVQKTIRNEFTECTVLTIAHRLNTIMDSNKIMLIDGGRLMEYDHPFLLLQNQESYFYKMVEQSGENTIRHFTALAKQAYDEYANTQ